MSTAVLLICLKQHHVYIIVSSKKFDVNPNARENENLLNQSWTVSEWEKKFRIEEEMSKFVCNFLLHFFLIVIGIERN